MKISKNIHKETLLKIFSMKKFIMKISKILFIFLFNYSENEPLIED
jgi:hypothetical protein